MSLPTLIAGAADDRLRGDQHHTTIRAQRKALVQRAEKLADELFHQELDPTGQAPTAALQRLADEGFLTATLPTHLGGCGLGTEAGGHSALLRILASFGGADLALGRLFEGHVNALILITAFGTPDQQRRAAFDAHQAKLFGVWNTGEPTPMRVEEGPRGLELHGCKTFATGARIVDRPIITAERNGWQMTLPRMEAIRPEGTVTVDTAAWQPLGMESSESYTICFGGARLLPEDLIGPPGSFYRDPLFRGGAIRFAAVQTGALARLARMFAEWLVRHNRHNDPYQVARLGEIEILTRTAVLWIQRAAEVAEQTLAADAEPQALRRAVQSGNLTRLAVERAATALMPLIIAGVGAHGLLRPARFERMLRDLTMYLRQPNPDGALADIGRTTLTEPASDLLATGLWTDAADD